MGRVVTLQDHANMTHNNDMIKISGNMMQENEIIPDIHFQESTDSNSHTFAQETYYPKGALRAYGRGVESDAGIEKQLTAQIVEHANPLEMDKRLLDRFPNKGKALSHKIHQNTEGSSQWLAQNIFYGNKFINSLDFNGLSLLFGEVGTDSNKSRVIDAGGTGNNLRSIHIIDWGEDQIYMLKPRGKGMPIEVGKPKECYLTDANGNKYEGIRVDQYINTGLVVQNPRFYMRIVNIDISASATLGNGLFHENLLIDAVHMMKKRGLSAKIYADSMINAAVAKRANEKNNTFYNVKDPFNGGEVPSFGGRPFRLVEALMPEDQVA